MLCIKMDDNNQNLEETQVRTAGTGSQDVKMSGSPDGIQNQLVSYRFQLSYHLLKDEFHPICLL